MAIPNDRHAQRRLATADTVGRTIVVMAATVCAIVSAAWLGSHLVAYDSRLAMVPAVPAAFAIGILTVGWLRARNGFMAVPLLGTLFAALAGADLLHSQIHWGGSVAATYEEVLLMTGTAAALASIVFAAVSGQRRPRYSVADTHARRLADQGPTALTEPPDSDAQISESPTDRC